MRPGVAEFYRANHRHQTVDFVRAKSEQYAPGKHGRMGVWEAMEFLDTLVDDSDPDTQVSQMQHLLQTAEAIRRDGHPRWFVLTGLVHDLGKALCLHGEPQWAAVGDTFPVGCRFSDQIVFPEFFAENPDSRRPDLMTETGMYQPGCGLDEVLHLLGPRRVHVPGGAALPAARGAGHDPLPLVLPLSTGRAPTARS